MINKRKIGKGKSSLLFDGDEVQFISYCKVDKKTGKERKKVSFLFYKNRELYADNVDPDSIFAKYDLRTTLGTGSFAVVKLGIDRESGERFAIKEIDKKKYELKSKSRKTNSIMNEANILQQISHRNIIQVYDIFDENGKLYIVLEMALGGELFQRIIDNKRLSEDTARYIMQQLLDAIMYLHDNKIAHRDLKPENILMKDKNSWEIKITDFGLSRLLECDQDMLTTMCGTPLFLAPEVLTSKKRGGYGFEVDYWSMGVILYLMLVGHPPYNEKEGALLELVKNGTFSFPQQTWQHVSADAKDLVEHLMQMDVAKRYNGRQVLAHRWMTSGNQVSGKKRKSAHVDDGCNSNNSKQHSDEHKELELPNDSNHNQHAKNHNHDERINCHDALNQEPALKKYKNANGEAVNTNQMSMDSFASHNLTPFDSMVDKSEPNRRDKEKANGKEAKPAIAANGNHHDDADDDDDGRAANGNGASFVIKNSMSLKEMSLD